MSARHTSARRRLVGAGAAASLALAVVGLAGPTVHPAAATPNTSSGKTCSRLNGEQVRPGDYMVVVTIVYNNQGQEVSHTRKKLICGEDGEWHEVAQLRVAGGRVKTVQTTVIRRTAKRARTR
jgi:hypothetical protein